MSRRDDVQQDPATGDDVCRHCGYTRRADDPDFIRGLCVRAHHEGDPSCWSRAGRPAP